MIPPRIDTPIRNALLDRNLLRRAMVRDAQVRRIIRNMVERSRSVGLDPRDGKGRAFRLGDMIVDKGVCQSPDETRLAGSTRGDPQLDGRVGVLGGAVVDFGRLHLTGCLLAGSVNEDARSHSEGS